MGHTDFETRVLEGLSEVRTNMRRLVGEDGNTGLIADYGERIQALENDRDQATGRREGMGWVRTVAAGGLGTAIGAALQKIHW